MIIDLIPADDRHWRDFHRGRGLLFSNENAADSHCDKSQTRAVETLDYLMTEVASRAATGTPGKEAPTNTPNPHAGAYFHPTAHEYRRRLTLANRHAGLRPGFLRGGCDYPRWIGVAGRGSLRKNVADSEQRDLYLDRRLRARARCRRWHERPCSAKNRRVGRPRADGRYLRHLESPGAARVIPRVLEDAQRLWRTLRHREKSRPRIR